ncbi:poly(U)-specific endoribonuclease-like [Lingula anatina]|uniref:Uridylate-specific endoribonuclease n=1 Tax=Lingula anatina TaxID=7574 RepID=A0A1S3JET4_LINAN|nr:poly(U)-specific endoribonuclease-like [Lingula anatina]|eukprot:XP_013408404.1 poly(U)-specific endoribonuclease-like [Lingula anatina]
MGTLRRHVSLILLSMLINASANEDFCDGRCGDSLDRTRSCQCNSACQRYGDCCEDYVDCCLVSDFCNGRCGAYIDGTRSCQCNSACQRYNNCCEDYVECCLSACNIEYRHCPVLITDDELSQLAEELYDVDSNKAASSDVILEDLGVQLFNYVNEASLLQNPSYSLFLSLLDNYNPYTGQLETLSSDELSEIDQYLDYILTTPVMVTLKTFLKQKGYASSDSAYRGLLDDLWFQLYPRSSFGPVDSSGFEHVMVGELKTSSVTGFHNWFRFYQLEKAGSLTYKGFRSSVQTSPQVLKVRLEWFGKSKPQSSFFLGTSPEYDMAVYTVCALARTNSRCPIKLAGKSVPIQTYDVAHKSGLQIATSYSVI